MTAAGKSPRKLFPRGLSQPDNGFRFSVDSLLLSCFISPKDNSSIADLGCGCGVIGLGLILANPDKKIQVTGLDSNPEMIAHARKNSLSLGMTNSFSVVNIDLSRVGSKSFNPESFELAVANPPWLKPGAGRIPGDPSKQQASFIEQEGLDHFFRAGSFLLKNKGKIGLVFDARRLDELLESMKRFSLVPKQLILVHGHQNKSASLVLVQGVKNAGPGLSVLPPLFLYDQSGRLTIQAMEFCPFLGCNPGRQKKNFA